MRKLTILKVATPADLATATQRGETAATNRKAALAHAPWAAELVRTDGGWIAFEDTEDARIWRRTK